MHIDYTFLSIRSFVQDVTDVGRLFVGEIELRVRYRQLLFGRHRTRGIILRSRFTASVRGSFPDFLHGDAYLRYFEVRADRSLSVYVRKLYRIAFDEEILFLDVRCIRFERGTAVDLAFKTYRR